MSEQRRNILSANKKHVIILGSIFAHPPADLEARLEAKGIEHSDSHLLMHKLYAKVDLNKKVFVMTIEDDDGTMIDVYTYSGDTIEVAYATLAGKQMSVRQANYAAADLKEGKAVSWKKGKNANVYHIHIYDDLIKEARENPESPRIKRLLALEASQAELEDRAQAAIEDDEPTDAPDASEQSAQDAQPASSLEVILEEAPPGPGTRTGIADPMPTEGEEGGDSENSQKSKNGVPAASPGPGIEESKNSLREKDNLSLSPKLLAQEFHELFGPEEPTEKLMNVSSLDFFRRAPDGTQSGILLDLMRDEKLIERFPDSSARGSACVAVVRGAFKIVIKTTDEWGEIKSPRFLNTPTGQRAISKARTEICRPSRVVDPGSEAQPISEALESLNPDTPNGQETARREPSSDADPAAEPKEFAFPLKNPSAKAWDREPSDETLDPSMQAMLDRIRRGTRPPDMDDEPSYKKAKPLRDAK